MAISGIWRRVGAVGLAHVDDLGFGAVRPRRHHDHRDRCQLCRVHSEYGDGEIGRMGDYAIGRFERKDEEVQALLLPGVDRLRLGDTRADRPVFERFLERHQQRKVGTGQVVGWRVLGSDLIVEIGRTGLDGLASTHHRAPFVMVERRRAPCSALQTFLPAIAYVQGVMVFTHCLTVFDAVLLIQPPHVAVTLTVWHTLSGFAG